MKIYKPSEVRDIIKQMLKQGLTPREIALGVAIGNFVGILPVLGLHTVLGMAVAYVFRLNQVVVFLGEQISNPLTFPFILIISAQLGNLILHGSMLELKVEGVDLLDYYLVPTVLGSVVLGLTVGTIFYFLVLKFARRYKS